jgi:hypothetical protein
LSDLRKILDAERESDQKSLPYEDLHYHLMQKIRILHGDTHPDRVARRGRVEPELALSVLPDLIEVLRASGLVRKLL